MKTLDEIKKMMAAGDTAKAAESLKELLAKEPQNVQAKMLYGTCCQLLGDEETFKRIYDELAPEMEAVSNYKTWEMWRKYAHMHGELVGVRTVIASAQRYPRQKYGCSPYRRTRSFGCMVLLAVALVIVAVMIVKLCIM